MKSLILSFLALFLIYDLSSAQSTIYPSGVTGCIARWDFASNGTITSLPDVSNNSNNGTVYNLTTASGFRNISNAAMGFDGSSSYAQVPNSTQLCPQQMTMISLVKFSGFYSGPCQNNQIISKGWPYFISGQYGLSVGDNNYDNSCSIYSPGYDEFNPSFNNAMLTFTQPASNYIDTGSWYFFASSYDGNTIKNYEVLMDANNYINNIAPIFTTTNLNIPIGSNTMDISIGKHFDPQFSYWFSGSMDEVAIFNKILSNSEIQSVYDYLWGVLTIDNPSADTSLCLGNSFNLGYTVHANSAVFQSGNVFTVQLSDASGSFASPLTIGSITATATGSIACSIPSNISAGAGYKMRLLASNPTYTIESSIHLKIGILPNPTIASNNTPICAGGILNLTAINGTPGVSYSWTGPNNFGSSSQDPVISNTVIADSGVYTVVVSIPGCTDTINTLAVITKPPLEGATVLIHVVPSDTFCIANQVAFTSTIANGGVNITYQWQKNGINISGATSSTYTSAVLNNGDSIVCMITVNDPCVIPYIVASNVVVMHAVSILPPPTVSITSSPAIAVPGTTVTFTAHVSNPTGITYQWRKNGINIPNATTSSYTTNTLNTGDQVTIKIHSSMPCVNPDTAVSNAITLDVNAISNKNYGLELYPNPNNGSFTLTGTISGSRTGAIEIINVIGQVVFKKRIALISSNLNEQINLNNLANGIYYLRFTSDNEYVNMPFTINK